MFAENDFGFFQRGPDRCRDEIRFRHGFRDGPIEISLELEIPIGDNTNQATMVIYNRHARYLKTRH